MKIVYCYCFQHVWIKAFEKGLREEKGLMMISTIKDRQADGQHLVHLYDCRLCRGWNVMEDSKRWSGNVSLVAIVIKLL